MEEEEHEEKYKEELEDESEPLEDKKDSKSFSLPHNSLDNVKMVPYFKESPIFMENHSTKKIHS